jgi:phage terminase large subunit-like protein
LRETLPVFTVRPHFRAHDQTLDSVRGYAPLLSTQGIVSVEALSEKIPVYDLTVEGEHEFFANGVLVHNCTKFWADELCAWRFGEEAWDNLLFGFRLGDDLRGVITTTPKPIKLIKDIIRDPATVVTRGSTRDNRGNLAAGFFESIIKKYEGTRIGRQEIEAELLEDVPGALWTRGAIDAYKIKYSEVRWDLFTRIVVAIDPAVTSGEDSDETGIVVAGLAISGHVVILADLTCKGSPLGWARIAVAAYKKYRADRIVGEVNNGGDLVAANIYAVAPEVSFRAVRASRGKAVRAEPVAALYEQGRVHHVGDFADMEQQMCSFVPGVSGKSPDRMDALVWAVTELVVDPEQEVHRMVLDANPSEDWF